MKRPNTTYWIITALFSAFIIFSSVGGITVNPQAVELMHVHLGYPNYFIQWFSVFKIIGAIAILLPMVPARVKKWVYFHFFVGLFTAVVSFIAVGAAVADWAPIFFIAVLLAAYGVYKRRQALRTAN
ncbi:MAG: DoxX family protein [Flavobacteriales bacterium]|nr:DoxX family protein [Flavobacteriales bacterium]